MAAVVLMVVEILGGGIFSDYDGGNGDGDCGEFFPAAMTAVVMVMMMRMGKGKGKGKGNGKGC